MKRPVILLLAGGLGLTLGLALRASRLYSQPAVNADAVINLVVSPANDHSRGPKSALPAIDQSPLATRLERDLSMSTGVIRWLYWMEAIEKASPSDFPRLARLAKGNRMALRCVGARWVELAPRQLFDVIAGQATALDDESRAALSRTLFDEWTKRDPQAVIAALNEVGDHGHLRDWRMQVATALMDTSPELGLRMMAEWHIENYGPRMTAVAKWAAADPQHAAEFAMQYPCGYASQLTMETIGKEWAKTDPSTALAFAARKSGSLSTQLAAAALKQWTEKDPGQAAEWLASANPSTRNRLSPAFVEAWAKNDASAALSWCQENLSGSSRAQAVGGVLKGAAAKDVAAAAALVSEMEPSAARAEGAAAVAKKWFPEMSSAKPIAPATIAWLEGLDGESRRRVLDAVTWSWSTCDPKSMGAFLSRMSAAEIPDYTESVLARQMVSGNPLEALEWASALPGARALAAGAVAFSEWRGSQPEAAMNWLNSLPPGDARRQPFFESAIRSLAYHPQAAQQLAGMTDKDRAAAKGVIQAMTLPEDRRTKLLEAVAH